MEKGLMTSGNITKQLVYFVIPLVLGNVLQQLYNAADSAIVGQFVSGDALAAVSSSGPLINLLISFFMGVSVGAGVVVARHFGAKRYDQMQQAIYSSYVFTLFGGVIMTFVGVLLSPSLLDLMGVPDEVMKESITYLEIYFYGVLGVMIYNMGSGILRALGDSKTPLYFLMIAALTNVVLDLVFVVVFKMGIAGAAWATLISQCLSAILVLILMFKGNDVYKLKLKEFKLYPSTFKEIIRFGLPSGIQNAFVSFSNLVVQSNINAFGSIAMAGAGAYTKIDGFAILPVQSFSLAITTYVGQNIGAEKYGRIREGFKRALVMSMGVSLIISLILTFGSPLILRVFSNDPEVISYGVKMSHMVAPAYAILAISHIAIGYLRAMNQSTLAMVVTFACWCGIRMAWILVLTPVFNQIEIVFLGWPISWIISSVIFAILVYHDFKRLPLHDLK